MSKYSIEQLEQKWVGKQFGKLTITRFDKRDPKSQTLIWWVCKCTCGNEKSIRANALGVRTTSCGCHKKTQQFAALIGFLHTKHGRSKTKLYWVWTAMHQRCKNPNVQYYDNYGGRGITVCKRWSKFENFLKDMGEPPPGLTLDRINNDKGYSPKNCRWADRSTQTRNSRRWLQKR